MLYIILKVLKSSQLWFPKAIAVAAACAVAIPVAVEAVAQVIVADAACVATENVVVVTGGVTGGGSSCR